MNQQPIERRVMDPAGTLDVHSIFYTFQGEGPFAGTPCVFVRLGGCNLQCPGCDTIYTDVPEQPNAAPKYKRKLYTAAELCKAVNSAHTTGRAYSNDLKALVVITGGEPFRQNVAPFIEQLIDDYGYYVQVESNGSFMPPDLNTEHGSWRHWADVGERKGAYLVTSPKTSKMSIGHANWSCAFKYVLSHESIADDGLPIYALDHSAGKGVARPPKEGNAAPVYLQPMDHSEAKRGMFLSHSQLLQENRLSQQAVLESCLKHGYIYQLQVHKLAGVE
jgi:7-carboxy-7-deazaguanine synthase